MFLIMNFEKGTIMVNLGHTDSITASTKGSDKGRVEIRHRLDEVFAFNVASPARLIKQIKSGLEKEAKILELDGKGTATIDGEEWTE